MKSFVLIGFVLCIPAGIRAAEPAAVPDYSSDIAPILRTYCVSCHNSQDREGKLSLESFHELLQGGESGPAVLAGDSGSSRLVRLVDGSAQPSMPPEGSERPSADEIALLKAWVEAGAKGPQGAEPDRTRLLTPRIEPQHTGRAAATALAWSPVGNLIAIGRFQTVELVRSIDRRLVTRLEGFPGKVTDLEFSADGKFLAVASGIAGLVGHASLWDTETGQKKQEFQGHRDILYAVALRPDGRQLATAGYDRSILLWDIASGRTVRTLEGHNGAVYSLAFHPEQPVLASASADETVKVWHVDQGLRLDTLGQPLAEQYSVLFSPDGQYIIAAGADHRIRIWQLLSMEKPRINPLVHARFAHEAGITQLALTSDGRTLVSMSEDRLIKTWALPALTQSEILDRKGEPAVTLSVAPSGKYLVISRTNGDVERLDLPSAVVRSRQDAGPVEDVVVRTDPQPPESLTEVEPNQTVDRAMSISVPARIAGVIDGDAASADQDLYRFESRAGQQWMVEVQAARDKSPLDSVVEVLDAGGQPIPRVQLRAVRDSYLTFRGKDSSTIDDFRLHNWEEMELNQYLYCNGEVVKLWLYPRGPDSGFQVYPGRGLRFTYFDTTPASHALQEPCYIVEPYPVGADVPQNGLPVFMVYYENDDDPRREWGSDSRLSFTAPTDGSYLVRIRDVRGFQGPEYKYTLTVRPRFPDFRVTLNGANPTVNAGSGREFNVTVDREDGFEGPIQVDIKGLPPGFHASTPVVIEAGQTIAYGVIWADADAVAPTDEMKNQTTVTATAQIGAATVTHDVNGFGEIKLAEASRITARLVADSPDADPSQPLVLELQPGQTITARVRVERNGFDDRVSFGTADAGRNLPHGVYVDNIGLNGLLILENTNERQFFITAAPWVPETTRLFHLLARVEGNQATIPVILKIRHPEKVADDSTP